MACKTRERVKRVKARMLKRQGYRCAYCKRNLKLQNATFDHVVPKAMGGGNAQTNLCLACKSCNQQKGRDPPHVFFMKVGLAL